jgi:transcription antitermination factor NusG
LSSTANYGNLERVTNHPSITYDQAEGDLASVFPLASLHQWFALRVRSNFERVAAIHLRERGYQEFLPTYTTRRNWSDRVKTVEKPLFPGYVFCSFDPYQRLPILTTPGVLHVVGLGKEPVAIDQAEIEAVWRTLQSGLPVRPWPFLQIGERIIVEQGPLAGVMGSVAEFKGTWRLVVSISLLQRSVSAEIERHWIRPLR